MFKFFYVLYKIKLLSPLGVYSLIKAIYKYGINLMALLSIAEKAYPDKVALIAEDETLSYRQLFSQSIELSIILRKNYNLQGGQKVGFICKNHASLVKAIFAVSRIGADVYLLNAEMSPSQFHALINNNNFDFLIYDQEVSPLVEQSTYRKEKLFSYHENLPAINNLLQKNLNENIKLQRSSSSKLVLLTGGTTGKSKAAVHQPSIGNYLNPFLSFVTKLKLTHYKTAYIATPIYHGYGIAVLLLFITLGKKVIIYRGFNTEKAVELIRKHHVEVVTVVPLMLYKMLKYHPKDLKSLSCIASGGATLNPKLVQKTFNQLGDVLYNLYGTSEAGSNIIATPEDLKYSPMTIGKKIKGVQLKILDEHKNEVKVGTIGQLCVKNSWSMRGRNSSWIETGDLGYQDKNGYYYLSGRVDDMVVSAGENVYPIEVEQILLNHPQIEDVAIIGISDEAFGQRLKAFILPIKNSTITKEELQEWLRSRVARFQLPKEIIFVNQMPYTPLGKLDKKQLKEEKGYLDIND